MKVRAGRRGFSFHLVEERPYTRRDGGQTTVKVWQAYCRDCRNPFQVTTPAAVEKARQSHAFQLRRCPACRAQAPVGQML